MDPNILRFVASFESIDQFMYGMDFVGIAMWLVATTIVPHGYANCVGQVLAKEKLFRSVECDFAINPPMSQIDSGYLLVNIIFR